MPVTRKQNIEMEEFMQKIMTQLATAEEQRRKEKEKAEELRRREKEETEKLRRREKEEMEEYRRIEKEEAAQRRIEKEKRRKEEREDLIAGINNKIEDVEEKIREDMRVSEDRIREEMKVTEERIREEVTLIVEDRLRRELQQQGASTQNDRVTVIPNAATANVKPPTFDGQSSWSVYKQQFNAVANANCWNEQQKATALVVALRGPALEILQTLSPGDQSNYHSLAAALELRFGDEHLRQVFVAQLRTKAQKAGESLQEFEADTKRLVHLAYPSAPDDFKNQLAAETFTNGLRDPEVRKVLQLANCKSSSEALVRALEAEAAFNSAKQFRVRGVTMSATDEGEDKIEKLVAAALEKMTSEFRKLTMNTGSATRQKRLECYRCHRFGHIRRDCRARSPAPARRTQEPDESEN